MSNPTNNQIAPPCLPMMLVDLISEFHTSAAGQKLLGNDDVSCAMAAARDRLSEVLNQWQEEQKAWQIHRAATNNARFSGQPAEVQQS